MKKLLAAMWMVFMAGMAIAQTSTTTVIHGAVVDKNGNPLPGAVVSATGGAEIALVEADGTFTMEIPIWLKSVTASYPGYGSKKRKPVFDKEMIFTLGRKEPRRAFLNVVGALPIGDGVTGGVGIMAGALGEWGFYGKLVVPFWSADLSDSMTLSQLTFGVVKHIYKNLYLSFGAGYGGANGWDYEWATSPGGYTYQHYYDVWESGVALEIGAMFKIGKHMNLSIGYTQTTNFNNCWNECPYLSFGYVF